MPETEPVPEIPSERPWTTAEVSNYYGESPPTTLRRVARGDLHPTRLPGGRRLLFDPAEVRQLVAGEQS